MIRISAREVNGVERVIDEKEKFIISARTPRWQQVLLYDYRFPNEVMKSSRR